MALLMLAEGCVQRFTPGGELFERAQGGLAVIPQVLSVFNQFTGGEFEVRIRRSFGAPRIFSAFSY